MEESMEYELWVEANSDYVSEAYGPTAITGKYEGDWCGEVFDDE
jgi:hypothetical protein